MADLRIVHGNLFASQAQTLVNTVNCVGAMGAGVALEFRLRYPTMFEAYVEACEAGEVQIGYLWPYQTRDRLVLNFPTKRHWKDDSKVAYLIAGLQTFRRTYRELGVTSAAFPLLGANHGGIDPKRSEQVMVEHLSHCDIPIEIYRFDPAAPDDLFRSIRHLVARGPQTKQAAALGIEAQQWDALSKALQNPSIANLSGLAKTKGVGIRTLEKVVEAAVYRAQHGNDTSTDLFGIPF